MLRTSCSVLLLVIIARAAVAQLPQPTMASPFVAVDLNLGESQDVDVPGGRKVRVKLIDLQEQRDTLRSAVRRAEVTVEIDGEQAKLVSATYHLPQTIGRL